MTNRTIEYQTRGASFVNSDPDATLYDRPHYTNPHYNQARTIYGGEVEGLEYEYYDRMWQWDYDKAETARKTACETVKNVHSAKWYQAFLSAYYDRPVDLVHILAGFNLSNGYPYQVFGFRVDAAPEGSDKA
jgi:hypothetical protein